MALSLRERFRAWILGPTKRRNYDGAVHSRLFSGWQTSLRSANEDIEGDLLRLRARSRSLCRNNPHAVAYLNAIRTNVAGHGGIGLQSQVVSTRKTLRQKANRDLELAFDTWGQAGNASLDGRLSWAELQQTVAALMDQDGEALVRIVRNAKNDFGFSLQLIDPDQLDEKLNENGGRGTPRIRMGVELDANGRAVAYHLWERHPSEVGRAGGSNRHIRVSSADLLHLYDAERPGQVRGVPKFASVMGALKMLDEWRFAAITAARIGASKMGFFVDKQGANIDPPDVDGDATEQGRIKMEVEAGLFGQLPPGVEFQAADFNYPNIEFESFERSILRGIAAGLGMSYATLTGDHGTDNYSNTRTGLMRERDLFRVRQCYLIEHLCKPVYREWLASAAAKQAITPPTYDLDLVAQSAVWKARGWPWIDPRNDVLTIKEKLALGLTSRTAESLAIGVDFEDTLEQLQKEQELAAEYGVNIAGITSQGDPNATEEDGKEEKDGETGKPKPGANQPGDGDGFASQRGVASGALRLTRQAG